MSGLNRSTPRNRAAKASTTRNRQRSLGATRNQNRDPPDIPAADRLIFEPIPHAMRHKCVRAVLPVDIWRLLRKMTIEAYGMRCAQCGASNQLECHEVWDYQTVPSADGVGRHMMKLVGLQALCHLCHVGKHIGFARTNMLQYQRVKTHLRAVYGVSDEEFGKLEHQAVEQVAELNRAGPRSLDLTMLNEERFVWIQHRFGRKFTDDGPVRNSVCGARICS